MEPIAERLAVTPAWVLAEARARRMPCYRLGRQVRFSWEGVEAYLDAQFVPPTQRGHSGRDSSVDLRVAGPKPRKKAARLQDNSRRGPDMALPGRMFPNGTLRPRAADDAGEGPPAISSLPSRSQWDPGMFPGPAGAVEVAGERWPRGREAAKLVEQRSGPAVFGAPRAAAPEG
jgi:excisionase family DNA binding protein